MVWQLLEIEGRDRNHPRWEGEEEEAEGLSTKAALGDLVDKVSDSLDSPGA